MKIEYYNLVDDSDIILDELRNKYPELNFIWRQVKDVVMENERVSYCEPEVNELEDEVERLEWEVEELETTVENLKADAKLLTNHLEHWTAEKESVDKLHDYLLDMLYEMGR